jgi:4'-phosphopantetheinyl transferase
VWNRFETRLKGIGMVELFALFLPEDMHSLIRPSLLAHVGWEKRQRILRFRKQMDAARVLFADLLVRYAASQKLGLDAGEISFMTNIYGKPEFRNPADLHFNVSHSGRWIVCAFSPSAVGVDIEEVKEVDPDAFPLALCSTEKEALSRLPLRERRNRFYTLWTIKESYSKFTGQGIQVPFSELEVVWNKEGNIAIRRRSEWIEDLYIRTFGIDPQYRMAVSSLHPLLECEVLALRLQDLLGFFEGYDHEREKRF